jgi:hypothetical protein
MDVDLLLKRLGLWDKRFAMKVRLCCRQSVGMYLDAINWTC